MNQPLADDSQPLAMRNKKSPASKHHANQIPQKYHPSLHEKNSEPFDFGGAIIGNGITTGDQVTTAFLFKLDPCVLSKGQEKDFRFRG